jgi:uncharacterized protein YbjT (DUF2867 family)
MNIEKSPRVLIIGATGTIGRLAVDAAVRHGLEIRALARNPERARKILPAGVDIIKGDLEDPSTLVPAVQDIDAIVFTHGAAGGPNAHQLVDYGGVANTLRALDGRRPRMALMTSITAVPDATGALDGAKDPQNLPLAKEPAPVREDLARIMAG